MKAALLLVLLLICSTVLGSHLRLRKRAHKRQGGSMLCIFNYGYKMFIRLKDQQTLTAASICHGDEEWDLNPQNDGTFCICHSHYGKCISYANDAIRAVHGCGENEKWYVEGQYIDKVFKAKNRGYYLDMGRDWSWWFGWGDYHLKPNGARIQWRVTSTFLKWTA